MRNQEALHDYIQGRRRVAILTTSAVALVAVMLFFYVWQYVKLVEIQMKITEARKENAALSERIETLEADRTNLARLDRVEDVAGKKLGMALYTKQQVWYIAAPADASPRAR